MQLILQPQGWTQKWTEWRQVYQLALPKMEQQVLLLIFQWRATNLLVYLLALLGLIVFH